MKKKPAGRVKISGVKYVREHLRGCCELYVSSGRIHNAGCPVEEAAAKYRAAVQSCADLLSILDRSVAAVGLIRNHWTPADVVALGRARDVAEGK